MYHCLTLYDYAVPVIHDELPVLLPARILYSLGWERPVCWVGGLECEGSDARDSLGVDLVTSDPHSKKFFGGAQGEKQQS